MSDKMKEPEPSDKAGWRKSLRVFVEAVLFIIGLGYLLKIFAAHGQDLGHFREAHWGGVGLSLGLFVSIHLTMALCHYRVLGTYFKVDTPLRLADMLRAVFLSNLGKYIPGKIWSFLAFGEIGRRLGIPYRHTSAIFIWHLAMGIGNAALLLALGRMLNDTQAWIGCLAVGLAGLLLVEPLGRKMLLPILVRFRPEATHRPYLRTIWVLQWSNALLSGFAYALLGWSLGDVDAFSFRACTAYPIGYMAAYLVFLVPAGVGVREAVLAGLMPAGSFVHPQILASRLITTGIDLFGALVVLAMSLGQILRPGKIVEGQD